VHAVLAAVSALSGSTGTTTAVFVVVLIAVGAAMVLVAVWLVHATRTDVPALGPLEVMGTRRWRRADPERRAASLAAARPADALGPAPMVPFDDAEPETVATPTPSPEPSPLAAVSAPAAVESSAAPGNGESSMQESASTAHNSEPAGEEPAGEEPAGEREPERTE
jgi:hypothetical protein